VGEIEDEFDLPERAIERIDDRTVRIHGTFSIDDFNEEVGVELPDEDYHTVAGFVFGQIGRAPEPRDVVEYEGLRFEVNEVEGSRIEKMTVKLPERPSERAEETAAEG
jgi:putative hemolysin